MGKAARSRHLRLRDHPSAESVGGTRIRMERRGWYRGWSFASLAALVLPGVATAMHGPGVCSPAEIDLACNPAAEIVTMDGTPARDEFRYCVPRYCSVPLVTYNGVRAGIATPIAPVNLNGVQVVAKGDAVQITCDPGYMLAGTASAQPTCVDGCVFEAMDSCVPVKCREPFKHPPNGVLSGGSMAALDRLALNRNYLEYDEYVKITCNHGYMASDSAHSYWEPCKVSYIRECLADARLSNAEIRCEPLVCREITGSDHALQYNLSGTVSQVATYQPPGPRNYKTNVTLTCNAGYGLIGGAAERECSWTCQYTQAQAVCTASTCNTTLEADSNTHWYGDEPDIFGEDGIIRCNDGHVYDQEHCHYRLPLSCSKAVAGLFATFNERLPTCREAKCRMSELVVPNSNRSAAGTSDLRARMTEEAIMCNHGYRAMTSDDSVPIVVPCDGPLEFMSACGGGPSLGQINYNPCGWNRAVTCRPVSCLVAPLADGTQTVSKGTIANISNVHYMEYGASLTMTCNTGFGLSNNENDKFVLPGAPITRVFECDGFCNTTQSWCKPVLCGDYTAPNGSQATFLSGGPPAQATDGDNPAATPAPTTFFPNMTYGDIVDVTCPSGHVVQGSGPCAKTFQVKCTVTAMGGPAVLTNKKSCEPFMCGDYHRQAPDNYSAPFTLCSHSPTCDDSPGRACQRMGCYGMEAYNTTDLKYSVHFRYTNVRGSVVTDLSVPDGAIAVRRPSDPPGGLEIICPEGYRINADEPSHVQNATSIQYDHCSPSNTNCSLNRFPPVPCSRLTCGNFQMPNMSATGLRAAAAFDSGVLLETVLYMEDITITCNSGHRIAAPRLTLGCDVRSFKVECDDDGGFVYRLSDGQNTALTSVPQCVPIKCNVNDLGAINGVKSPQEGMLGLGETVEVTCNPGYRVNNDTTALSRCSDAPSFNATCEDAKCAFSGPGPLCKPVGCNGVRAAMLLTEDAFFNVSFAYGGRIMSHDALSEGGVVQHGVDLTVTCPSGYRVSSSPYPISSRPQSETISCSAATCELPNVTCFRKMCLSTKMSFNSSGARKDTYVPENAVSLAGGDNISNLLYGEVVTVACDASNRLAGSSACSSNAQNFSYECSDESNDDYGLRYLHGFSSTRMPHQLVCEPVTCNVADVGAQNGVRVPASGAVEDTKHATVTCNSGFFVKPVNVTRHPVCGDETSFSLTCTGCNFPDRKDQPRCEKRGCLGTPLNRTEDGLQTVTYSIEVCKDDGGFRDKHNFPCSAWREVDCSTYSTSANPYNAEDWSAVKSACPKACKICTDDSLRVLETDIPDGEYLVGDKVRVDCPEGYLVPSTLIIEKKVVTSPNGGPTTYKIDRTVGPTRPDEVTVVTAGTKTTTTTISTTEDSGWTDLYPDHITGKITQIFGVDYKELYPDYANPKFREPDARFAYSECNSDSCGMGPVTCRRLACGNFTIPPNATATFGGDAVSAPAQFMTFNETLTITCAEGFILDTSDIVDCQHSYTVRCNGSGLFESHEPVENKRARDVVPGARWGVGRPLVQCVPTMKRIYCAEINNNRCYKSWGVGVDEGEPNFPTGFAALDCTVGHCDPPHGHEYHEVPRDTGNSERCQIERGSTIAPCLPVQCRPLPVPHGAKWIEMDGQRYQADSHDIYPTTFCGEVVRVYCNEDETPEELVYSGLDCTHNYFNMTCDGRGFWTGYQRCVPKMCVISEEHMTFALKPGETYCSKIYCDDDGNKLCPIGTNAVRPGEAEDEDQGDSAVTSAPGTTEAASETTPAPPSETTTPALAGTTTPAPSALVPAWPPRCQRETCLLSVQQECKPWNCSAYVRGLHVDNTTEILRAPYGQTTTVRCADGYAATTPGVIGCSQTFQALCQADKNFNRQDGQQCFPTACPPYHLVANNIKITAVTSMPASEGEDFEVRCKDEFGGGMGWGFNDSSILHSHYSVRGSPAVASITCGSACTWQQIRHCIRVPCKCMTFSSWSDGLESPTDGSMNPILHSSEADGFMDPLETKALQCPRGYEPDRPGGTLECRNDCSLATSGMRCVPRRCQWQDLGFVSQGVKVAPAAMDTMLVGQTVRVQCHEGFELSMEPPPAAQIKKIAGLEALGNVKVLFEKSFPTPDTTKEVSYSLDGSFANVKLDLPPGAWPEGLGVGPSMSIFEFPATKENRTSCKDDGGFRDKHNFPCSAWRGFDCSTYSTSAYPYNAEDLSAVKSACPKACKICIPPKKVAGKCIFFGPSGIKFSKPVTIALPLDLSTLDMAGMMLRPHRYNPADNTWTEIPLPEGYVLPSFPDCQALQENITNGTSTPSPSADTNSTTGNVTTGNVTKDIPPECDPNAPPPVIKGATMSFSAYGVLSIPVPAPTITTTTTPGILIPLTTPLEDNSKPFPTVPVVIGIILGVLVVIALVIVYQKYGVKQGDAKPILKSDVQDMSASPGNQFNMRDEMTSPLFPASSPKVVARNALAGTEVQAPPRNVPSAGVSVQPGSRGIDGGPEPPPRRGPASVPGSDANPDAHLSQLSPYVQDASPVPASRLAAPSLSTNGGYYGEPSGIHPGYTRYSRSPPPGPPLQIGEA